MASLAFCASSVNSASLPEPLLLFILISEVGEFGTSCERGEFDRAETGGAAGAGDRGCWCMIRLQAVRTDSVIEEERPQYRLSCSSMKARAPIFQNYNQRGIPFSDRSKRKWEDGGSAMEGHANETTAESKRSRQTRKTVTKTTTTIDAKQ